MDSFPRSRPPAPPPLFQIAPELRLLIYEFLFTCPEPSADQLLLPRSSANLEPLCACRIIYTEARLLAFALTVHNMNWTRASSCLRRLRGLDAAQHANIKHVALTSTPAGLYDKLLPLRYQFDHIQPPYLSLETLTIILDLPDTSTRAARERRIQEQNMVFDSVWFFKNIKKVVLLNITDRDNLKAYLKMPGEWTSLGPIDSVADSGIADETSPENTRWRFELTTFYDYAWKPWLAQSKDTPVHMVDSARLSTPQQQVCFNH